MSVGTPSAGIFERSLEQYQIISVLGKGAMGTVYLAYDPLMHRMVALKMFDSSAVSDDLKRAIARFLMEVTLTGRLTHAGIIPIYEVGHDSRYGYFYTMRYVKGRSLHDLLKDRGNTGWGEESGYSLTRLIALFFRVCESVSFAHQNGVLHRDLKPANVMITDSNEVLVLDWGVAKDLATHDIFNDLRNYTNEEMIDQCRARRDEALQLFLGFRDLPGNDTAVFHAATTIEDGETMPINQLTQAGTTIGTPAYMSPEQITETYALTPASDVYSLGVILYQILCGSLPVDTSHLGEMYVAVSQGHITPLESRPEAFRLPKVLCEITGKCLKLDPSERYTDARELAAVIQLYQEGSTPVRVLVKENFAHHFQDPNIEDFDTLWKIQGGSARQTETGLQLSTGTFLCSKRTSLGDFRCTLGFNAMSGPWSMSVIIGTNQENTVLMSHHEIRIGVEERPFIELLCMRGRMQRRFDLRLQSEQDYRLEIAYEEEYTRVRIDGMLLLNYREIFPQTGGTVALYIRRGEIMLHDFEWLSHGAPLRLSYQFLPDKHFRMKRFKEARTLYLQLAESHPDREEGLMALYKAGLCSAELNETQMAFDLFSKLENTMLDHYCATGFARIGMLQFNLEWAWEALKSAYMRHHHPDVRSDMWFGMLTILELMGDDPEQKISKYLEMLNELEPSPQELNQITYEYLDLVRHSFGLKRMRKEAATLLQRHTANPSLMNEALLALWHSGIDEDVEPLVRASLDVILKSGTSDPNYLRYLLITAELKIAQLQFIDAAGFLEKVIQDSGNNRSESIWARNWLILSMYLQGEYRFAVDKALKELKKSGTGIIDQQAYLLLMIGLSFVHIDKRDHGYSAITQASRCSGWWGEVAMAIIEQRPPESMSLQHQSPNLGSEALWIAGESHFLLGNIDLANSFFLHCEHHPSRRIMTRRLAQERLKSATGNH